MKAVILAAGRGSRLDEKTEPINKCMLEFSGRPLVEYSLENAVLGDVSEIILVVGYRAQDIINRYGIEYKGIRIQYVIQEDQKGLVHAVEKCKTVLDGDDFILMLADEIFISHRSKEMIAVFEKENLFSVCGVTKVEDLELIKKTYSMIFDKNDNRLYRLIEKPRNPINDIMGTGNCIFRNEILDYVQYTPISYVRNEKELPDLIQCAIDDGKLVKMFFVSDKYVNINTPEDIILAEQMLGNKEPLK